MQQLNVVCLGTWGIERNNDEIRLVTVENHHHIFEAGNRDEPRTSLIIGKNYRLEVVSQSPAAESKQERPKFDADSNPTVYPRDDPQGRPQLHADLTKVPGISIDLPYPQEIYSVRSAPVTKKL